MDALRDFYLNKMGLRVSEAIPLGMPMTVIEDPAGEWLELIEDLQA